MTQAQILHITAPLVKPGGGDADYTRELTESLQLLGENAIYFTGADIVNIASQGVVEEVLNRRPSPETTQVVHLQVRPPHGGTLIKPEQLSEFDVSVVTVHEFIYFPDDAMREIVLSYVEKADHVIFTNPHELEAVAFYLPDVVNKSSVIPVHPTIPINYQPPEEVARPNNILTFGTIRDGKGYPDVVELARLMKENPILNPDGSEAEIYVVGSAVNHRMVRALIEATYGLSVDDIPCDEMQESLQKRAKGNSVALVLGAAYLESHSDEYPRVLPIRLFFNVPEQDLAAKFERCNFAYQPIERGATYHSTVVPAVMANGCICITKEGAHTPDALKHGEVWFTTNPQEALDVINRLAVQPDVAIETRRKAHDYVRSISPEASAMRHQEIYEGLIRAHAQENEIPGSVGTDAHHQGKGLDNGQQHDKPTQYLG